MFANEHRDGQGDPTIELPAVDLPFAWPLRQDREGTMWAVVLLTSGTRYLRLRDAGGRLVPADTYATSQEPEGLRRAR